MPPRVEELAFMCVLICVCFPAQHHLNSNCLVTSFFCTVSKITSPRDIIMMHTQESYFGFRFLCCICTECNLLFGLLRLQGCNPRLHSFLLCFQLCCFIFGHQNFLCLLVLGTTGATAHCKGGRSWPWYS